jgi:abortive infection bacteriophage resistance protein
MKIPFITILLILIIIYIYSSQQITEPFTPKIRTLYRPIIRNTRLITEGFYHKYTSILSNLLRIRL